MTPERPEALPVANRGATFDFDYLERWATELDVGDLLERALAED